MGLFRANETNNWNKLNRFKNPNWQEADQLALCKHRRGVEPGTTSNKARWWSEQELGISKFQVRHPNHSATLPLTFIACLFMNLNIYLLQTYRTWCTSLWSSSFSADKISARQLSEFHYQRMQEPWRLCNDNTKRVLPLIECYSLYSRRLQFWWLQQSFWRNENISKMFGFQTCQHWGKRWLVIAEKCSYAKFLW